MEINTFDIVRVDFGDVEFAGEQGGIRPAVIIQNAYGNIFSGTTIVLPFTTKIKHLQQPTHWEYRELFRDICNALRGYSDEWKWIVDNLFHVKCDEVGYCTEAKSCGRKPEREM